LSNTRSGSTFQVDEFTGWARDLSVEVAGGEVVSHTGSVALRALADRAFLTGAVSTVLSRRRFTPVHDRGWVLSDMQLTPGRAAFSPR
jgi:hypothetical protein